MTFRQFLNSLSELYLSFYSESLDCNCTLIYISVLWLLLLFFCFLVKISTFWENEPTRKCQSRAKRRRKGGTQKGWRCYQREEEEKKVLISMFKSPLGQHHDSTRFRQLLCPDPSCEVCNNATAEMDQLLFSLALEEAALSVPPLASIAPVTEPSFTESPAFSAFSPGYLIPPPLPEPFPSHPSILSPNPMTPLCDFPSPSPPVHSLPQTPFPSLESEIPVNHSTPQTHDFPSLPPHDSQSVETPLTLNTIFLDSSITQDISPIPNLAQTVNPTGSVSFNQVLPTLSVLPSPDCTSTVTQPKSLYISSKPVLENSSPDGTGALSTRVLQGTDHPRLLASDVSCQKALAKDSLPSTFCSDKDVEYDSEKDLCSSMMTLLGQTVSQRKLENALKVHLSKKFEEISENRVPETVHSSWHTIKQCL